MAHFAQINDSNVVLQVIVVDNKDTSDASGVEKEHIGKAFCEKLFGGNWVKTSYNGSIRKNYAGIGYTYDSARDAFIGPKPFNSWVLNETSCKWEAPSAMPSDGKQYRWDEDTTSWLEITP